MQLFGINGLNPVRLVRTVCTCCCISIIHIFTTPVAAKAKKLLCLRGDCKYSLLKYFVPKTYFSLAYFIHMCCMYCNIRCANLSLTKKTSQKNPCHFCECPNQFCRFIDSSKKQSKKGNKIVLCINQCLLNAIERAIQEGTIARNGKFFRPVSSAEGNENFMHTPPYHPPPHPPLGGLYNQWNKLRVCEETSSVRGVFSVVSTEKELFSVSALSFFLSFFFSYLSLLCIFFVSSLSLLCLFLVTFVSSLSSLYCLWYLSANIFFHLKMGKGTACVPSFRIILVLLTQDCQRETLA